MLVVVRRHRGRRMRLAGTLTGATEASELRPGPATQLYRRLMLSIAGRKMRRLRRLISVAGVEERSVSGVLTRSRPQYACILAAVHAVERRCGRRRRVPTTGTSIRRRDVRSCTESRKRKLESGGARRTGDSGMMAVQHHRCCSAVVKPARPARPLDTRLAGSGVDHVTGSGAARRPVGAAEAVGGMLEVVGVVLV